MIREFMTKEVETQFLEHISYLIFEYSNTNKTELEKLECLSCSILAMLDGEVGTIPKFIVAPNPEPDDINFDITHNQNYYPENHKIAHTIKCDISGNLHEKLCELLNRKKLGL